MKLFYFLVIFILVLQSSLIIYNTSGNDHYGLYNRDVFSYYIQVKASAVDMNPFNEPVLYDGKADIVRVPFSFPHFITGLITRFSSPGFAYLLLCIIGSGVYYGSLFLLGRSFDLNANVASVSAFVHYVLFQVLSQLPPLSLNQLGYVVRYFTFADQTLLHNGPRQYPHDMFFYPLLYTLLALTICGVRKIINREHITFWAIGLWVVLCMLLPFNYFYHWFEFMFILSATALIGLILKWSTIIDLCTKYRVVVIGVVGVYIFWIAVVLFQSFQFASKEGYLFSLMSGLTEARFGLFPQGALIRLFLWVSIALFIFRFQVHAVMLCIYLVACIVLLNMQLVVGKTIQPGHWLFGTDRVFAWLLILVIVNLASRWLAIRYRKGVMVSVLVFTSVFFVIQNTYSWGNFFENSRWPKERAELVQFLNQQKPGVLLVPELWLETDLLISTHHYAYLPRGAQSVVSLDDLWQRLTSAAFILGYSKEGLTSWVHTRAVRFFGFLYGSDIEFSSSLFFDPKTRDDVLSFESGNIIESDWERIDQYVKDTTQLVGKLDYVVLHRDETIPDALGDVLFENGDFVVLKAPVIVEKKWGTGVPVDEKPYPLVRKGLTSSQ